MHLSRLAAEIERLRGEGRLRLPDDTCRAQRLKEQFGEDFVDAASNDYLGLAALRVDAEVDPLPCLVSRETRSVARALTPPRGASLEPSGLHSTEPALPPEPGGVADLAPGRPPSERPRTSAARTPLSEDHWPLHVMAPRAQASADGPWGSAPTGLGAQLPQPARRAPGPALGTTDPAGHSGAGDPLAFRPTDPALRASTPEADPELLSWRATDPADPAADPELLSWRATDPADPAPDPALRATDPADPAPDPALRATDPAFPPPDHPWLGAAGQQLAAAPPAPDPGSPAVAGAASESPLAEDILSLRAMDPALRPTDPAFPGTTPPRMTDPAPDPAPDPALRATDPALRTPDPAFPGTTPPRMTDPAPRATDSALRTPDPAPRASGPALGTTDPAGHSGAGEPLAFRPTDPALRASTPAADPELLSWRATDPADPAPDPALRATDPADPAPDPEFLSWRATDPADPVPDPALRATDPALRTPDPAFPGTTPPRMTDPALRATDPALRTPEPTFLGTGPRRITGALPTTDPADPCRDIAAFAVEDSEALYAAHSPSAVSRETMQIGEQSEARNQAPPPPRSGPLSAGGQRASLTEGWEGPEAETESPLSIGSQKVRLGPPGRAPGVHSGFASPTIIPRLPFGPAAPSAVVAGGVPREQPPESQGPEGRQMDSGGTIAPTPTAETPAIDATEQRGATGPHTLFSPDIAPSLEGLREESSESPLVYPSPAEPGLSPPRAPSPPYRPPQGGAVEPPSLLPALPGQPAARQGSRRAESPRLGSPRPAGPPLLHPAGPPLLHPGGPTPVQARPVPKGALGGKPRGAAADVRLDRKRFGASLGAGASRLIFGTTPEHLEAEKLTAEWLGFEESLLFSSGYAANIGALGALLSPDDAVFSDALNHASLIDGIRLSRAQPTILPHLDMEKLEQALRAAAGRPARWVIVESYYSMDGDGPDLLRLRELCSRHDAHLYCDEAHSVGVFGPEGRGLCAQAGIRPDVLMAGFGKAVGAQGACVLGSAPLRTWLWNRARSFVFSTAPSPLLAQTLIGQIRRTRRSAAARAALADVTHHVRTALEEAGIQLPSQSFGPVVSIVVGAERDALHLAERLQDQGILAQAVRPPTVPEGQSRIRLVLRSSFRREQCTRLAQVVARETKAQLGSG